MVAAGFGPIAAQTLGFGLGILGMMPGAGSSVIRRTAGSA